MTHFETLCDRVWLSSWVAASHLGADQLVAYRRDFGAHPARLILLRSFLPPGIANDISQFLEHEAEFLPTHGLYSRPGAGREITAEEWQDAAPEDRLFRFREPSGVLPESRLGPNVVAYLKVLRALGDARFVRLMESVSGLALGSPHVNVHRMIAGDFLAPHNDAHDDRRLTFVLFLSREWHPAFGGTLHLTNAAGGYWTVEPAFNTLAIFDINGHEEHWVTPIAPAAGHRARVTVGGWIGNRPVR